MIVYNAFYNCNSLETVIILSSDLTVVEDAFEEVTSITKVYFKGDKDNNNLALDTPSSEFGNATIYYFTTSGKDETAVGNWWYYDDLNNIVELVIE